MRSDEAEGWFHAVYFAVQQIPVGRVCSYGHIASLLGHPRRARQVGVCLKHLPNDTSNSYHAGNVPWQRVVNSKGMISHRGPGAAARQAQVLRAEGVAVQENSMGEFSIDLAEHGWFPTRLPLALDGLSPVVSDEDEEDAIP